MVPEGDSRVTWRRKRDKEGVLGDRNREERKMNAGRGEKEEIWGVSEARQRRRVM